MSTHKIRALIRTSSLLVAFLMLVLFVKVSGLQLSPAKGAQVHGFVSAGMGGGDIPLPTNGKNPFVRLPNARVFVVNLSTGVASAAVATDAFGYFIVPKQISGRYRLCVEASGFVPTCDPQLISIGLETVVLDHDLTIAPLPGAIQGRVLLNDGKPCYQENAVFGTSIGTKVVLLSGRTAVAGAMANSAGQFVLPKIPGPGNYAIMADCMGSTASRAVSLTSTDLLGLNLFDLSFGNAAPVVTGLSSNARWANPGQRVTVTLRAYDPDGDPLQYKWSDGTTGFASVNSPTFFWTLPTTPSTNILYVQVSDGKGGYAYDSVSIPTGAPGQVFSGRVIDRITSAPIGGAVVRVNGKTTTSSPLGLFHVKVAETRRYVVNVDKPAYALLSRIFYSGTTGVDLPLDRAQRRVVEAVKGGVAVFEGAGQARTSARVSIPGGTLVNSAGVKASGPVNVDLHVYDLSRTNPIPGDQSARITTGADVRLESFGALNVDITDAAGVALNLEPGALASISLAVDPARLAAAPPVIPFFTYDEKTGYWIQVGDAKLVGNRYETAVKHFSAFNADTVFTNTACIKFRVDPQDGPKLPFILKVSMPSSAGPVNHNDFPVNDPTNGLFRLPPNTLVTLEVHPASGPDVVIKSFTVNSGAAIPDSYNGFPPYPYNACAGFDPASTAPGRPVVLKLDLPAHEPYLSRPGRFPPSSETLTNAYYTNVGAIGGPRNTFTDFKNINHFSVDPNTPVPGEAVAYYYNAGDLGLGREMHCLKTGANTACYVTNYGDSFPPAAEAQPAIDDAINHNSPIATVAMEHVPSAGVNAVRFYAYKADGSLFKNPALDTEGPKFLPQMCLTCHGGSYNASTNNVENASFLPFDVYSFKFDTNPATGYTLANQQDQFRQLNAMVRATNPNAPNSNQPIHRLIDGLYPCGVNNPGCNSVDTPYVPPDWSTRPQLYTNIPRPYCRTCHIAQPSGLDWTRLDQFDTSRRASIERVVCTSTLRAMPHAELTFKNFWYSTNPHGPAYLKDATTGLGFSSCVP